jgi:chaperonin cofactor prefoldin
MKRKDRIEQAIIDLVSVCQNLNETTQDILCRLDDIQDRVKALEHKQRHAERIEKMWHSIEAMPDPPETPKRFKLDDLVVWRQ